MAGCHGVREGNHTQRKYTGYQEFKNDRTLIVRIKGYKKMSTQLF